MHRPRLGIRKRRSKKPVPDTPLLNLEQFARPAPFYTF
jgi:hypothetical protein